MRVSKKILIFFVMFISLFSAKNAWALYRQPIAITITDWVMALALVVFTFYVFIKVKFNSSRRFWISLGLLIFNVLVWIGTHTYILYIEKRVEGFGVLKYLEIPGNILYYLWVASVPISIFLISLLSKKKKKMVMCLLGMIIAFCSIEIGLNYYEINGYLSNIEKSNYREFRDATAIRNYLSASSISGLRFYPKSRTKKVLLAELDSSSWLVRREGALSLRYLRDPSTIPELLECMCIQDETDKYDGARRQCAVTLEMLLSNDYSFSVYDRIEEEYEKTPEKLFKRLEKRARE